MFPHGLQLLDVHMRADTKKQIPKVILDYIAVLDQRCAAARDSSLNVIVLFCLLCSIIVLNVACLNVAIISLFVCRFPSSPLYSQLFMSSP